MDPLQIEKQIEKEIKTRKKWPWVRSMRSRDRKEWRLKKMGQCNAYQGWSLLPKLLHHCRSARQSVITTDRRRGSERGKREMEEKQRRKTRSQFLKNKNELDWQERPSVFKNMSCWGYIEKQFKVKRKQIRWTRLQNLELHRLQSPFAKKIKPGPHQWLAYMSKSDLSEKNHCIFFPSLIHFTSSR